MTTQTLKLAGKRFVIVEEAEFRKLVREAEQTRSMTRQDWGDVAESKRRLAEPGANIPWARVKSERKSTARARKA